MPTRKNKKKREELEKTVGGRLYLSREKANLMQTEIEEALGLPPKKMSEYENRSADIPTSVLSKLKEKYGFDWEYIATGTYSYQGMKEICVEDIKKLSRDIKKFQDILDKILERLDKS